MSDFTPYMLSFKARTEGIVGSKKTYEETIEKITNDLKDTYGEDVSDVELRLLTDEEKEEYKDLLELLEDPLEGLGPQEEIPGLLN